MGVNELQNGLRLKLKSKVQFVLSELLDRLVFALFSEISLIPFDQAPLAKHFTGKRKKISLHKRVYCAVIYCSRFCKYLLNRYDVQVARYQYKRKCLVGLDETRKLEKEKWHAECILYLLDEVQVTSNIAIVMRWHMLWDNAEYEFYLTRAAARNLYKAPPSTSMHQNISCLLLETEYGLENLNACRTFNLSRNVYEQVYSM